MRRERHAKLQEQLEAQALDGLLLVGSSTVSYATGGAAPGADSSRGLTMRPVAVVVRGAEAPHLFTPYPEGAPPELPPDHLHHPLFPDLDDGARAMARAMAELFSAGARVGVDEHTHPMMRALTDLDLVTASTVLGAAKLLKTPDELACIRGAQRLNELAMADVERSLRPGTRQIELTSLFLRRILDRKSVV